jgi:hypothetical protein
VRESQETVDAATSPIVDLFINNSGVDAAPSPIVDPGVDAETSPIGTKSAEEWYEEGYYLKGVANID